MHAGLWLSVWLAVVPMVSGAGAGLADLAGLPGSQSMLRLIGELEKQAEQDHWEEASDTAKRLESNFQHKFWLLQLLGDEEEYEGIDRSMARLNAAVDMRDRTQVKLLLAEIRMTLRQIFSL